MLFMMLVVMIYHAYRNDVSYIIYMTLLPLQGVVSVCHCTQGVALGYMLLPFQGVFTIAQFIYIIYITY